MLYEDLLEMMTKEGDAETSSSRGAYLQSISKLISTASLDHVLNFLVRFDKNAHSLDLNKAQQRMGTIILHRITMHEDGGYKGK
jgi:hypothetical protein